MENYKEIKNYIHNDLGITKEYVDNLIIKAVKDEVHKTFNNETYITNIIEKTISLEVRKTVCGESSWHTIHDMSDMIRNEIVTSICNKVKDEVIISLKGDNNEG